MLIAQGRCMMNIEELNYEYGTGTIDIVPSCEPENLFDLSNGNMIDKYNGESYNRVLNDTDEHGTTRTRVQRIIVMDPQETIYLPEGNGISTILSAAFKYLCVTKHIVCSDAIEEIYTCAFFNCLSIETIFIPKSLRVLEKNAFHNLPNVTIFFEGSRDMIYDACDTSISELLDLEKNRVIYNCTREMYDEYRRI